MLSVTGADWLNPETVINMVSAVKKIIFLMIGNLNGLL
jgi:hypothetical protein